MKQYAAICLLAAALLAPGCAPLQKPLVLDRVGPAFAQHASADAKGTLIVFSAFDVHAHFNDLPYRRFYSDYEVLSEDGRLLQTVRNQQGLAEAPRHVELPAGAYRIAARANGYGSVIVPVMIAADQVTTVDLGTGHLRRKISMLSSNPVRLPDGQIVGYKADSAASPKH